ncbi:MAG: HAD family hydrolase [Solirubrobacterales bacterium]
MADTKGRRYLLIFDCDGVLVDSEPTSNRVLAAAISAVGLPMSAEQVADSFEGMRLADIQSGVEAQLGRKLPAGWLADFEADRAAAFEKDLVPVSGVDAVLTEAVDAGFPMCVASQARREKTALTLGLTGLSRFFPEAVLFSSTMVEHGKPHPGLFLLAAETMGFDPADCVVVEDGVPGVEAGHAAGMRVLGYAPAGCDPNRLSMKGAEVFPSMADLPALLGF